MHIRKLSWAFKPIKLKYLLFYTVHITLEREDFVVTWHLTKIQRNQFFHKTYGLCHLGLFGPKHKFMTLNSSQMAQINHSSQAVYLFCQLMFTLPPLDSRRYNDLGQHSIEVINFLINSINTHFPLRPCQYNPYLLHDFDSTAINNGVCFVEMHHFHSLDHSNSQRTTIQRGNLLLLIVDLEIRLLFMFWETLNVTCSSSTRRAALSIKLELHTLISFTKNHQTCRSKNNIIDGEI